MNERSMKCEFKKMLTLNPCIVSYFENDRSQLCELNFLSGAIWSAWIDTNWERCSKNIDTMRKIKHHSSLSHVWNNPQKHEIDEADVDSRK